MQRTRFPTATPCLALVSLQLCCAAALAQDGPDTPATQSRYVVGAILSSAAEYPGSETKVSKLRPLWAYQYGRWRISTSRASAVLGFAADAAGPGASTELAASDRWKFGAALRFDSGRKSSDSANLQGLPDIRRTLRGRLYASYDLTKQWSLSGNVSQDLLGRQGGATVNLDAGYRLRTSERTEWTAGGGMALASAQNMRTYFGITDLQAQQTGQRAFNPGAGLKDAHLGIGVTTAITPRWIAFATFGTSRLLGDAASSPLTRQATSSGATAGLAYRCCN